MTEQAKPKTSFARIIITPIILLVAGYLVGESALARVAERMHATTTTTTTTRLGVSSTGRAVAGDGDLDEGGG